MSMVAGSIKEIVSIKIKSRHDGVTDQYNRIFMVKMCIMCSAIIGVNYFNDKVSCIVTNGNGMGDSFVGSTCWIQGFYIFKEMFGRLEESGYFGIPRNMDYDGVNSKNKLCTVKNRAGDEVDDCKPMEKVFYLQYQYMPFFTAALALLFYFPYIVFKTTNSDIMSLKDDLENEKDHNVDTILDTYFNYKTNSHFNMRKRVAMNIFVKVLYLTANVVAFMTCDALLLGNFRTYGSDYVVWSKLKNYEAHDHNLKVRSTSKPGNVVLPPMGYCDVHEASRDVRNTHINYHRVICEISPHVLYQYVMLVFWFSLFVGIIVSTIGLLISLFGQLIAIICFLGSKDGSRRLHRKLTFREIDYLEYIRSKDMTMYGKVLQALPSRRNKDSYQMKDKSQYNPSLL